ncbi:GntR family transcriptional regulator [Chelatococcus asaccharovorans]|uniref:GntR family transcriptional regulator n=1 Tax=Chelatococcus asaccharovorans TaxID=28210 RepID=A0A2V3UAB8_9HYPH|nr:GntR family transcriptional regulator [Chelatococcus asaccharovorans]MBS7705381.1 GntR family transcriptional regulator [Chelatococcus asaccharovorans]PXW60214.1 GntR family transcriptional regulator [Chelatococcus asaccharovorans]CAH1655180.1 GntR family transcriptional regulator [Chelatococcus asaccharovorans]CAH1685507.1 GntR family transcriptional regulator [Chelatococcus asaccharovorans]
MTMVRIDAVSSGQEDNRAVSETIVARLAQRLREEILSGQLSSGTRLKLRELSDRFGVSQMPIRDALVKLSSEGLVELQPNRGAAVRQIDHQFIENMFDIRMMLEELLVRRAIERSSDAELASLRPLANRHAEAAQRGTFPELMAANLAFHGRITDLARNAEAARILDQGWELIYALRGQTGYAEGRLQDIIDEHNALVAAIEARDVETAGRLARQHVERSRDDALARFTLR